MNFNFELGKPFHPYEQLMGVLPVASKDHIPLAYQVNRLRTIPPTPQLTPLKDLMFDVNSPILDFYPLDFEQDLNGKKQEWEAIVKIPFIDEVRLLKAMGCKSYSFSS
jgi:5'-3' exoribonuclease 1